MCEWGLARGILGHPSRAARRRALSRRRQTPPPLTPHPSHLTSPPHPQNNSGESVAALAKYYKVPLTRCLVIADDLDSAPAVVKLKQRGGHGGHNGLRSIIDRFGGKSDFPRLKIGAARAHGVFLAPLARCACCARRACCDAAQRAQPRPSTLASARAQASGGPRARWTSPRTCCRTSGSQRWPKLTTPSRVGPRLYFVGLFRPLRACCCRGFLEPCGRARLLTTTAAAVAARAESIKIITSILSLGLDKALSGSRV